MPYKKSSARKDSECGFKDIYVRIRLSQKKGVDVKLREYVISSAIFLSHAILENYISDIFHKFAETAYRSAQAGAALPDNLTAFLFWERFNKKKVIAAELGLSSEQESMTAIAASLKGHSGSLVDSSRDIFYLNGKDIYTNSKYPSKENLIKIFTRLGEPKIFTSIDKILRKNSENILTSLSDLRTQLAHTAEMPGISPGDVIKRIEGIEDFIRGVDRVMYKIVHINFGSESW